MIEDVRSHPWILSPSMDASYALANGSSMLIPVLWVIPKCPAWEGFVIVLEQ